MKRIDDIERALDAYMVLNDTQKQAFHNALRLLERFTKGAFPKYVGTTEEKPKRGRPAGSKNRKPANPLEPDTFEHSALFAANGAVTEDL
jgi:hypothetical protein